MEEEIEKLQEEKEELAQKNSETGCNPPVKKKSAKEFFSARKIATLGVFAALSYVVMLIDFPIFPAVPFLKLDFSNVFVMLVGFAFGPIEGVVVLVVKEVLHIPIGTTGGVGELANIFMGLAYIIVPSSVYYFKKGFKIVIPTLLVGVVLQIGVALLCNRYITFPLYMKEGASSFFNDTYPFIIAFNAIKGVANSVLCLALYKYLSKAFKKLKIK